MNKGAFSKNNWLVLILFGLIGQIAWAVENMYFNLFIFETFPPNLDAITLMVQLSGCDGCNARRGYALGQSGSKKKIYIHRIYHLGRYGRTLRFHQARAF